MEQMLNGTMLAAIVAGDKFTGFRCKRDGMSAPKATELAYRVAGREYRVQYQMWTCEMSDGSKWEIWFAPIDEERLVFYKNAREITV